MRVGLFPTMAGRQAGGPETYEVSLFRALMAERPDLDCRVFCLSERAKQAMQVSGAAASYQVLRPSTRWISVPVSLPLALRRSGSDLLHAMLIAPPATGVPMVFTVHDLTMLRNPEFYNPLIRFRLQQSIRPAIQKAKRLICISDFVKRELQAEFDLSSDRLATVHHGVHARYRPVRDAAERVATALGVTRPYLLFIGQMKRRKNIHRILEAFAGVRRAGCDVDLVLAGRRGHTTEGMDEIIDRHGLRSYVHEPGHVPDDLLPALYSAASVFLFPSLNEGFGLPVLEAMACGTPVVTSYSSALPEVAGDAALLVDPEQTAAITEATLQLLTNDDLRKRLIAAGNQQAARFSWARCARETLAVYEQALA